MAEYIDIRQLWKCETCFHHQGGSCSTSIWCDHGESYRPAYVMLKKADVVPVVRCKDCLHYEMGVCLKIYSDGAVSKYAWQERNPDDFCSYGERKDGEG